MNLTTEDMSVRTEDMGLTTEDMGLTTEDMSVRTEDMSLVAEDGWTLETTTEAADGTVTSPPDAAAAAAAAETLTASTCGHAHYEIFMYCGMIGFLLCFGLVGNSLSVFTMWPKRNANATSLILIVLSFLDSILLIVWFYQLTIPALCRFHQTCEWHLAFRHPYLNQFGWPIGTMAHLAGAWVVVLVTGHRYIAVCYPLKVVRWGSVKVAKIQVTLICVGSVLFCFPRLFDDDVVMSETGARLVASRMKQATFSYGMLYNVIIYYLVIFVAPLSLLSVMTFRLIRSLKAVKEKRAQMTKSKRDEDDMTQTLVVVVLVFMICQIANPIRRLIVQTVPASARGCGSGYYFYQPISSILICSNCAANFVVYFVCGRRFRQTLKRRLLWLLRRGTKIDPGASVTLDMQNTTSGKPPATVNTTGGSTDI